MVKMEEMSGNLISISPNAEYLGEVVDGMYVMTFSKTLVENTTYTITASPDIVNLIGDTLGENVNIEFKTIDSVNEISLASIKNADGHEVTDLFRSFR